MNELQAAAERRKPGAFNDILETEALADWAKKVLDPTPLTPEVLNRVGFEVVELYRDGGEHLKFGKLECVWEICSGKPYISWLWHIPQDMKPRTLGELRMICHRLGISLKEPC